MDLHFILDSKNNTPAYSHYLERKNGIAVILGMTPEEIHRCLSLGHGTLYTLAAIVSVCRESHRLQHEGRKVGSAVPTVEEISEVVSNLILKEVHKS